MERSLFYVSRKSLSFLNSGQAIEELVAKARLHNARMGITGALASTEDHFAQLLEGPAAAVDDLMQRIDRDTRHTDVTVLRIEAISRRQLPEWSMAYHGASTYIARLIVPLVGETIGTNPVRVERLLSMLVGLAGPVPIGQNAE